MKRTYIVTKQGACITISSDNDGAKIVVKDVASGQIMNMKLQESEKQHFLSALSENHGEEEAVNIFGFFAVSAPEEINNILLTMDPSEKAEIGAEGFESVEQIISISKVEDAWVVYYRKPVR